jgi:hypothetical protein
MFILNKPRSCEASRFATESGSAPLADSDSKVRLTVDRLVLDVRSRFPHPRYWYSSADARVPLVLTPPVTKTVPFFSNVAVCARRGVCMPPVPVKVPVLGL